MIVNECPLGFCEKQICNTKKFIENRFATEKDIFCYIKIGLQKNWYQYKVKVVKPGRSRLSLVDYRKALVNYGPARGIMGQPGELPSSPGNYGPTQRITGQPRENTHSEEKISCVG